MTSLKLLERAVVNLSNSLIRRHHFNNQQIIPTICRTTFAGSTSINKIHIKCSNSQHLTQYSAKFFSSKPKTDHVAVNEPCKKEAVSEIDLFDGQSNLGLFAKFKLMYKKYWYVLIPVHVVTSIGWLGGFYYLSQSGVDVPALLQSMHLSETIIEKVKNSSMGHVAIAYLCYKVATPVRYAVTLGGTTLSIKYLVQFGYIKPMPTKKELIQMYEDRKAERAAAKIKEAEK